MWSSFRLRDSVRVTRIDASIYPDGISLRPCGIVWNLNTSQFFNCGCDQGFSQCTILGSGQTRNKPISRWFFFPNYRSCKAIHQNETGWLNFKAKATSEEKITGIWVTILNLWNRNSRNSHFQLVINSIVCWSCPQYASGNTPCW